MQNTENTETPNGYYRDEDGDIRPIISVWSAYGHTFMSTGDGDESCLSCGAVYQLVATPDGMNDGAYVNNAGDDPTECTRNQHNLIHGVHLGAHLDDDAIDAATTGCACNFCTA